MIKPNNYVSLTGNLGKDPEIKRFENNEGLASFSLATSDSYKDKNGEKNTVTEWHNIVIYKGFEIAEKYLKKGSKIQLIGKLRTRSWDDKAGIKKYITEVVVYSFLMLGGKVEQSNENNLDDNVTEDLPF